MDKTEAFSSLSEMIFKGFLTAELNLDGKPFIFKTVNEKEYELIKFYAGNPDSPQFDTRFNILFIIFSLFIVENTNILIERDKKIPEFFDFFMNLPDVLYKKILEHLNVIRVAAYENLKYLEGFTYSAHSRNFWKSLNGGAVTEFTGIPGTSSLGLNIHQENWIILNRHLDDEEVYHKNFSLALLISSSTNPKGAKSLRAQQDSNIQMTEDRRNKLIEEGFIDKGKVDPNKWTASVDTAEDLVAELNRQMSGKKDRHDLFFEKYMQNLKDEALKRTSEAEERIKKSRELHDNVFIDGSQRALSAEETLKLLSKKNRNIIEVASEEAVTPEKKELFYKKIGSHLLTSN